MVWFLCSNDGGTISNLSVVVWTTEFDSFTFSNILFIDCWNVLFNSKKISYHKYKIAFNGDMTDSKFIIGVFMPCNDFYSYGCVIISWRSTQHIFHLWVLKSRYVEVEMGRLKSWSKSYKNIWACIFTIVHTSLKFSYLQGLVTLKKDVTPISNILIDVTFVMDTICLWAFLKIKMSQKRKWAKGQK